jgi:hypothetical protein
MAVREQGTPVMASPEHHRDLLVETDNDQVHSGHESVSGTPISQFTPDRDLHAGRSEGGHLHHLLLGA